MKELDFTALRTFLSDEIAPESLCELLGFLERDYTQLLLKGTDKDLPLAEESRALWYLGELRQALAATQKN